MALRRRPPLQPVGKQAPPVFLASVLERSASCEILWAHPSSNTERSKTMTEVASLISAYGLPTVIGAALIYILLRGEVRFRYPRSRKRP